jgi:uncharacterized protein YcnI
MRKLLTMLITAAALAVLPAAASAHVQVTPAEAAPDDAVLFEFLMPNEREQSTVSVALKIPDGVIPFSFEATPGWTRTTEPDGSGGVGVVRWKGRLASDGFVRFAMLASTPPTAGPIAWKAVQTYSDGVKSSWIGAPGSENPAPVTEITKTAAAQNAGGENSSAAPASSSAEQPQASGGGSQTLAIVLAAVALLLAAAALVVALRSRSSS